MALPTVMNPSSMIWQTPSAATAAALAMGGRSDDAGELNARRRPSPIATRANRPGSRTRGGQPVPGLGGDQQIAARIGAASGIRRTPKG
ncbi:MAG TPA: hypothetical protein VMK13_01485 [Streptosporangiaceae bacterium]|nr:hypothetical protein [Streptosporangiaceae bacterium]